MSKSWMVMSRKMPPERTMKSQGGGSGSREMIVTISTSPIRPSSIVRFNARKSGSNRR